MMANDNDDHNDSDTGGFRLADPDRVQELLDQLADQVKGSMKKDTALVGILRRGAPLAGMLARRLAELGLDEPEVGELKLKRYSDELELLHDQPELDEETLDIWVEERHLVLVDDVLYSGESLFRASCFLRGHGAKHLQLAVLCARGRPSMPIRPDFVALQLDVGPDWIVDCAVPPYEDELGIVINPRPDSD